MEKIESDYAKQFIVENTTSIDYTTHYFKMARKLGDVAEHYNRSLSEDIFMGYSEVAQMIESLAMLYKNGKGEKEIINAKETIFEEFNRLVLDLEDYFSSYPDEISQRDIANGKLLALSFSTQS
jgi:hypothetical protein